VLVAGMVLLLAAACGSGGDGAGGDRETAGTSTSTSRERGGESTTTSSSTTAPTTSTTPSTAPSTTTGSGGEPPPAPAATSLNVTVTGQGGQTRAGTLTCGDAATGTGFLADPATAEAACTLVRTNQEARQRLIEGRDPGQMCTMIYGGPEVAQAQGQLDGQPVDQSIDRTDGCGVADWELLTPLLGPPGA
jgi:hypothetical protein